MKKFIFIVLGSLFSLGSLQGDAIGDQKAVDQQLEAKRVQEKVDADAREQQRVQNALIQNRIDDQRAADRRAEQRRQDNRRNN
jgi:hypothetical protein